jgi:dihydroflavonol-4-reductase
VRSSIPGLENHKAARRALVTGGSGFVGQHLVSALVARSRRVRILDIRPPKSASPNVQYVAGSACDPHTVDEALNGIDEVYHLAAMPGMWTPNKQDFVAANCLSTEVMLAAAQQHGIARFLHCSTESVLFGRAASENLITEETQTSMDEMPGVYTRSKKAAEDLALRAAAEGVPVVIANPTMPIGPHDYELTPPTTMIRHFLHHRIQVYVDFVINIVDVRDAAAGLILAMELGQVGQRYIFGGENTSLRRLLELMSRATGRANLRLCLPTTLAMAMAAMMEFVADHASRRPPLATMEGVEIARRSRPLSSEKARRELGYTVRPLKDALSETICWLETSRINF